jgi:hypothetical protein
MHELRKYERLQLVPQFLMEEPKKADGTDLSFAEFLVTVPPNSERQVRDLFKEIKANYGPVYHLILDDLSLYCASTECERVQKYENRDGSVSVDGSQQVFLRYVCRNCRKSGKTFAIFVKLAQGGSGIAVKFGEVPVFGSHTPARLITLIGPDRDLFLKGRRAENLGLGMGAFAYYRRVVENQKDRILGEVRRVAVKVGLGQDVLATLDAAIKETQFSKAVDLTKAGFPQGLLIEGANPLTLLHDALSKGLHVYDDAICLELATDIRLVLAELAERLTQLLRDDAELKQAVNRLRARPATA